MTEVVPLAGISHILKIVTYVTPLVAVSYIKKKNVADVAPLTAISHILKTM